MKSLQHYDMPTFTDAENVFLQHYAETGNRVDAMLYAGLATDPDQAAHIELAAAQIIAKAETMPIGQIASALGADKIQVLAEIWKIAKGQYDDKRDTIKALYLLARIHAMLGPDKASSKSVNLILQTPTPPKSATPEGLPFLLEVTPNK